ncbi:hypothetical protein ACGFNU_24365 [Spirillospora sp. NPDC048911]
MASIHLPDPEAPATELDEDQVLVELYGEPNEDGVFRGDGA